MKKGDGVKVKGQKKNWEQKEEKFFDQKMILTKVMTNILKLKFNQQIF